MQLFFFLFGFYNSTCFGRSLRPSHHQAIKPIEPWNIIHTTNDSNTGFILSCTHDTHQWLLLQFVILLMMDANCVWNM